MKRSEVAALAAGLALVLAGVFVAMSLVTWDVRDPHVTANYEGGRQVVRNRCGAGGALVASFLFRAHGAAACAVPLALAALGGYFLLRRSIETGLQRAVGAVVLILALSLLAGTRANGWLAWLMARRSIEGPGGTFGAVPVVVLTRFLGGVGTYLVILFALGAGSLLASRRAVETVLGLIGWALTAVGRAVVSAGRKPAALFARPGNRARKSEHGDEADRKEQKGPSGGPVRKGLFESILAAGREAAEAKAALAGAAGRDLPEKGRGEVGTTTWTPPRGEAGDETKDEAEAEVGDKAKSKVKIKSKKAFSRPAAVSVDRAAQVPPGAAPAALRPTPPPAAKSGPRRCPHPAAEGSKGAVSGGKQEQSEAITRRMPVSHVVEQTSSGRSRARACPSREDASDGYRLPPAELLLEEEARPEVDRGELAERGMRIVKTLAEFNIETKLIDVARGPAVTMYEFELAPGINVNRVTQLSSNIAMAVAAQDVRIVAPIPGRGTIGIEVPNLEPEIVRMRSLVEHYRSQPDRLALPVMLGRGSTGEPLVADLSKMPHLLVAGATGSGKSVCMDGIIMSMMMLRRPDQVKLLLVDPKVVEFSRYRGIPHLASPVVTEMKRAASVLDWAVRSMDERYRMFGVTSVRDIASFNGMPADERERLARRKGADDPGAFERNMPYVVILVDELADLMMVATKEVENSVIRLAQKSRSTGIHVVLATQRPSVDVLTGIIKANMPTRISFQVASRLESRIILDRNGADKLLGKGDMLYMPAGLSSPVRAKGVYVTDDEIAAVLGHLRAQPKIEDAEVVDCAAEGAHGGADAGAHRVGSDELYGQAVAIVLGTQRGSVSLLQRRLGVGYTRAGKLIDMMFADGLVGPQRGSKPREILVTLDEWETSRGGRALKKSA